MEVTYMQSSREIVTNSKGGWYNALTELHGEKFIFRLKNEKDLRPKNITFYFCCDFVELCDHYLFLESFKNYLKIPRWIQIQALFIPKNRCLENTYLDYLWFAIGDSLHMSGVYNAELECFWGIRLFLKHAQETTKTFSSKYFSVYLRSFLPEFYT